MAIRDFFIGILELNIGMSLLILLMLALLKLIGGKFTARCRYILWTLVIIRLALPFGFGIPAIIELPIGVETQSQTPDEQQPVQYPPDYAPTFSASSAVPVTTGKPLQLQEPVMIPEVPETDPTTSGQNQSMTLEKAVTYLSYLYLTAAAVYLLWIFPSYLLYTFKITRWAKEPDERTRAVYDSVCVNQKIRHAPRLLISSDVNSPIAFGLVKRKIVLPDIFLTNEGLAGTLSHELTHCRRGDLWIKAFSLLARAFNWFNPLVHWAAMRCEMEMELSCDEAVLAGCGEDVRAAYGDVMLDIIRQCRRKGGVLTTHFNPKKRAVKARFINIMYGSGKRRGLWLIGACVVLCVTAGAVVACKTVKPDEKPDAEAVDMPETDSGENPEENSDELDLLVSKIYELSLSPIMKCFATGCGNVEYDISSSQYTEDNEYYIVTDPWFAEAGVDSVESLRNYLLGYFSPEYTDRLLDSSVTFRDINGKLCIHLYDGGNSAVYDFPEFSAEHIDDSRIRLTCLSICNMPLVEPEPYLMEFEFVQTDGGWVIDEAPSLLDYLWIRFGVENELTASLVEKISQAAESPVLNCFAVGCQAVGRSVESSGVPDYYMINDQWFEENGINSVKAVEDYLLTSFTPDCVDRLFSENPSLFNDIDGRLCISDYVSENSAVYEFPDITASYTSDDKICLTCYVTPGASFEHPDPYKLYFYFVKQDGEWLIDYTPSVKDLVRLRFSENILWEYNELYGEFLATAFAPYTKLLSASEYLDLDSNGVPELILQDLAYGACEIYTIENGEVRAFYSGDSIFTHYSDERKPLAPPSENAKDLMFYGATTLMSSDIQPTFLPAEEKSTGRKGYMLCSVWGNDMTCNWEYYFFTQGSDGLLTVELLEIYRAEAVNSNTSNGWEFYSGLNMLSGSQFMAEITELWRSFADEYGVSFTQENTMCPLTHLTEKTPPIHLLLDILESLDVDEPMVRIAKTIPSTQMSISSANGWGFDEAKELAGQLREFSYKQSEQSEEPEDAQIAVMSSTEQDFSLYFHENSDVVEMNLDGETYVFEAAQMTEETGSIFEAVTAWFDAAVENGKN